MELIIKQLDFEWWGRSVCTPGVEDEGKTDKTIEELLAADGWKPRGESRYVRMLPMSTDLQRKDATGLESIPRAERPDKKSGSEPTYMQRVW